jgi:hypothetical protein
MKKYFGLAIAIWMFVAVMAVSARAQMFGSQQMRARIPFAFNVGRTNLPAGEYTITVLNPNSDQKVLQIRSSDARLSAIINTTGVNANAPDKAKLVFNRYGEKYFFSQVQMAGEATTLAAVKSSAERNAQHSVARNVHRTTVTIVAS